MADANGRAVAVIDCGTNSTRLLVAHATSRGDHGAASIEAGGDLSTAVVPAATPVHRAERITGLGRGRSTDGTLQPEAIGRVCEALAEYREELQRHDVAAVRAVATSAAREALNGGEFLAQASEAIGLPVELLSAEQEAALSYTGALTGLADATAGCTANPVANSTSPSGLAESRATATTDATAQVVAGPYLVADIGGGSTELAVSDAAGDPAASVAWRSIALGSVSCTEQYLTSDPPRPEELSAAISLIRTHLSDIDLTEPVIGKANQLVGTGGTLTTIAAVEQGLTTYNSSAVDGFILTRAAAEDTFRTLATERLADRLHNPGLPAARAGVIVGGCCLLVAIMRHWKFDSCVVREADLTDAIASELASQLVQRQTA